MTTPSPKQPLYCEIHVAPTEGRLVDLAAEAINRYLDLFEKYKVKATILFFPQSAKNFIPAHPEVIERIKKMGLLAGGTILEGEGSQFTTHTVTLDELLEMHNLKPREEAARHLATGRNATIDMPEDYKAPRPLMPPIIKGKDFQTIACRTDQPFVWCMGELVIPPRRMSFSQGSMFIRMSPRKDMIEEGILPRVINPVEKVKRLLEILPCDQFNYITIHLHDGESYYGDPRGCADPEPPTIQNPQIDEAYWEAYEELLAFVATHPEIEIVTVDELLEKARQFVEPLPKERTVPRETIHEMADFVRRCFSWREQAIDYVEVGDEFFSLADTFQAFTYALDAYGHDGVLPDSVTIREIMGPLEDARAKPGERFSMNEEGWMYLEDYPHRKKIMETGQTNYPLQKGVDTRDIMFDRFWSAHSFDNDVLVPKNQLLEAIAEFMPQLEKAVPSKISLLAAGRPVNPYEFLFLMAQALRQIESGQPFKNVLLMWAFEIPRQAGMLAMTHGFYTKEARLMPEKKWLSLLQLWTFKPARLKGCALGHTSDGVDAS